MVRLTAILRRKPGMTPKEFHEYWRNHHGPLVMSTKNGSYVVRYEQHHRPLEDYQGDDDPGYDGVTVQWYESKETYEASLAEEDFTSVVAQDIAKFLDLDRLHFVVTEDPVVIAEGPTDVQPVA